MPTRRNGSSGKGKPRKSVSKLPVASSSASNAGSFRKPKEAEWTDELSKSTKPSSTGAFKRPSGASSTGSMKRVSSPSAAGSFKRQGGGSTGRNGLNGASDRITPVPSKAGTSAGRGGRGTRRVSTAGIPSIGGAGSPSASGQIGISSRGGEGASRGAGSSRRGAAPKHGTPKHGAPNNGAVKSGVPVKGRIRSQRGAKTPAKKHTVGKRQISANLWSEGSKTVESSSPRKSKAPSFISSFTKIPVVRVAACVILTLVLIGGIDTAVCWGKIYNGVQVGDLDLSGKSVEEAQAEIDSVYNQRLNSASIIICRSNEVLTKVNNGEEVDDLEDEDVSVAEAAAAQQTWKTDAATLQVNVNSEELAKKALEVGREDGGIFYRLGAQLFGCIIPAQLNINDTAIEKLGKDIDQTMGDARVNYNVKITDGVAEVTEGHDGQMVSRSWLKQMLNYQLTSPDAEHAFVAEISYAPLQINAEQAQACADSINGSISKGATLVFQDKSWAVDSTMLGKWVKTRVDETSDPSTAEADKTYTLTPYLNVEKARSNILQHLTPAMDKTKAKVEFAVDGDNVTVYPNVTGIMPVVADAVTALEGVLFAENTPDSISIEVAGTEIPESMSLDDALDYGVVEKVSTYTTEYTADDKNRNTNIHLAAELLNNSVAKANGGTWSFNETAGECNEEKGFKGAGVIVDNQTVDSVGGGICQVATTIFNAVYDAGYPVVTRHNHTLYITSYPSGRDAAVSWPDLDFVWKNDSNSDVLVTSSYTDTTVTFDLYGIDPGYEVKTEEGKWKKGEKYKTITEKDDTLAKGTTYTKTSGWNGSEITVKRLVYNSSGKLLRTDEFESIYSPRNEVVVKGTG